MASDDRTLEALLVCSVLVSQTQPLHVLLGRHLTRATATSPSAARQQPPSGSAEPRLTVTQRMLSKRIPKTSAWRLHRESGERKFDF